MTPNPEAVGQAARYFAGEREAIAAVIAQADIYGYGNLIMHLKEAWAATLRAQNFGAADADRGAGIICPWCDVDCRTGKKARKRGKR